MATFTATASQVSNTDLGLSLSLRVVTGAAALTSQPGATTAVTTSAISQALTPTFSGSWVYGAAVAISGTYTLLASTIASLDSNETDGLHHTALRSSGTTTAATPVTLGYSAAGTVISWALAEIVSSGTLAEDASSPAAVYTNSVTSVTTAAFTPPSGALLVAMINSNGATGSAVVSMSDTSGLGMSWTQAAVANQVSGDGNASIWITQVPVAAVNVPAGSPAGSSAAVASNAMISVTLRP